VGRLEKGKKSRGLEKVAESMKKVMIYVEGQAKNIAGGQSVLA